MNVVTLMGRLTRDPNYKETKTDKGEHHIADFYLAVPRNYGNDTNYIKITAFGTQAEFARDFLRKGKRIAVTGELMTGSYQDEETGKTMRTAEVTASRLEFADGKEPGAPGGPMPAEEAEAFTDIPEGLEDELPFR